MLIYIDDLLLVGKKAVVDRAKEDLSKRYEMIDLGPVKRFLGITVERNRPAWKLKLHQGPYIEGLLHRYGLQDCNPVRMPMTTGVALSKDDSSKLLVDHEIT